MNVVFAQQFEYNINISTSNHPLSPINKTENRPNKSTRIQHDTTTLEGKV
jgi:hypothetical protein